MQDVIYLLFNLSLPQKIFVISLVLALGFHIAVKIIDKKHSMDPEYEYEQAKKIEEYERKLERQRIEALDLDEEFASYSYENEDTE